MVAFAEAPRRPLPGAARHRLPRQHRLRGERARAPARPDGDRQRGRPRRPRRVPRLDRRDRRDHDVHARQPARARDAARVGPRGRGAEHVPRPAPWPGRRDPLRRRRPRDPRAPRRRRPGARRLHRRGAVRQRRRRHPPRRLPARGLRGRPRGGRARDRGRGPGGLRPPRRAPLGLRAAGRGPGHRHGRQGRGQRHGRGRRDHDPRDRRRLRRRGLVLLVRGRLAGVVRGGARGPARDRRRGPPGERARCRGTPARGARACHGGQPARGGHPRDGPLPGRGARPRPGDARAGRWRGARDLRAAPRAGRRLPADRRREQRAQGQAAAVPDPRERGRRSSRRSGSRSAAGSDRPAIRPPNARTFVDAEGRVPSMVAATTVGTTLSSRTRSPAPGST